MMIWTRKVVGTSRRHQHQPRRCCIQVEIEISIIERMRTNTPAPNDWHVVNAFRRRVSVYLTMRKQFLVEEKNWSLPGTQH
jgi:hypothetical protein